MKAIREIERKYYKYALEEFSMPSFGSNKGWGTVSNSENSSNAYYIFDNPSSGGNKYSKYTSGGYVTIDWYWDCPDYLQLTSVYYWGQTYSESSYSTASLTVYGWDYSTNDWKQLGYQENSGYSDYSNYDVSCTELLTNKFKFTVVFRNLNDYFPSSLTELVPKGYKRVSVKGTIDDYDYYRDEPVYKLPKKVERKYYKYVETEFVQPVLTSNGTLGGDSFACTANSEYSPAYNMFDGKAEYGGPFWLAYSYAFTGNVWFSFYNPNPLKIYSFTSYFQNANGYGYNIKSGTVYGSNDYNSWDTISTFSGLSGITVTVNVNSTKYYKYYKVHIDSNQGNNQVAINQININADEKIAIETTQDDYNYYVDVPIYYAVNK